MMKPHPLASLVSITLGVGSCLSSMTPAWAGGLTHETRPQDTRVESLLSHIEQGDELAGPSAQELYDIEADLTHAKPVLIEALSAGWTDNKCYLYWTLELKIGLTPEDLTALSRVELGPKPEYRERVGDNLFDTQDNYGEVQDWEYVVRPLSEALLADPDAYLAFLRNHPGALSVFRTNEPCLIYLFAEAKPQTKALRDYLVMREDLPSMFDIDLAAGDRVGVLESYPTAGNACFPPPFLISVIVREGRCDVADAPVPEGYAIAYRCGLAKIEVDGFVGFTDAVGLIRIPPSFQGAGEFRDGVAACWEDGKCGMIDIEGEVLIEPRFDRYYHLSETLRHVIEDGKHGVISVQGEVLVEPVYSYISFDYARDCILATTPDGVTGIIDAQGGFIPDAE